MEVGVVLLASRSKSRQIVEESSKSSKSLKGLKNLQRPSVRRNVYRSTDPPSIGNEELEPPLQLWLFLLGLGALSIPFFNRLPTRQSEWSCLCSVAFFPRGARKIFELKTLESSTSCNQRSLCTKVCRQNARSPSAQILEMRSGRRRPSPESAWWREGCWGSCASPWPVLRSRNHQNWADYWENSRTRCQEMLVATDTYPVRRTPATTRSLSLSGTCQWILWRIVISTD